MNAKCAMRASHGFKLGFTTALWLLPSACTIATAFSISPAMNPEQVVRKQLDCFQKSDVAAAFQYSSPENQLVSGPLEDFEEMLRTEDIYKPIVGHAKADILMTVAHEDWGMCCLVRLVPSFPHSRPCLEYWWELTKQEEGRMAGCWMIDSVLPDFEDLSVSALEEMFDEGDDDIFFDAMDIFDEDDDDDDQY